MQAEHMSDWMRKSYVGKLFTRRFLYHGKMRVMLISNRPWRILCASRVQNCVMLRGAHEFAAQHKENKIFRGPFAACRNDAGNRWVITAWTPIHRAWGNDLCPCLHADPKFPDAEPGQTVEVNGWLSFHEGTDIDAEIERLRKRWSIPGE